MRPWIGWRVMKPTAVEIIVIIIIIIIIIPEWCQCAQWFNSVVLVTWFMLRRWDVCFSSWSSLTSCWSTPTPSLCSIRCRSTSSSQPARFSSPSPDCHSPTRRHVRLSSVSNNNNNNNKPTISKRSNMEWNTNTHYKGANCQCTAKYSDALLLSCQLQLNKQVLTLDLKHPATADSWCLMAIGSMLLERTQQKIIARSLLMLRRRRRSPRVDDLSLLWWHSVSVLCARFEILNEISLTTSVMKIYDDLHKQIYNQLTISLMYYNVYL